MENKEIIKVTKLYEDAEYIAIGMKPTDDGLRVQTEGCCTGAHMLEAIQELCTKFLEEKYFPAAISSSMVCAAVDNAIKNVLGITPISDAMGKAAKTELGDDFDELMDLLGDLFGGKKKAEKKDEPEQKPEPEKVVEKVEENVEKPEAIRVTIERVKGGKKG